MVVKYAATTYKGFYLRSTFLSCWKCKLINHFCIIILNYKIKMIMILTYFIVWNVHPGVTSLLVIWSNNDWSDGYLRWQSTALQPNWRLLTYHGSLYVTISANLRLYQLSDSHRGGLIKVASSNSRLPNLHS